MLVTGVSGNVVSVLIDADDLAVLRRALMCVNVDNFDEMIGKLQKASILSSECDYVSVIGHAITTMVHIENGLAKFKQGEAYKKMLEEVKIETPVC